MLCNIKFSMTPLLGIYGLFFEFANPGFVVPGIVGAICFLLAMYALQLLPINFAGLALLILGIIFMIVEAIMPSFGALGIGGVIAFVAGSILLLDTNTPGFGISWTLILLMALLNAIFFFGILAMAFRAKRRKIVSGREAMIGLQGYALEDLAMTGQVQVHGEIWQAQAQAQTKISKGDKIEVIHIQGLLLIVTPIEKQEGDRK